MNAKLVSVKHGEFMKEILQEFQKLWNSSATWDFENFIEEHTKGYKARI